MNRRQWITQEVNHTLLKSCLHRIWRWTSRPLECPKWCPVTQCSFSLRSKSNPILIPNQFAVFRILCSFVFQPHSIALPRKVYLFSFKTSPKSRTELLINLVEQIWENYFGLLKEASLNRQPLLLGVPWLPPEPSIQCMCIHQTSMLPSAAGTLRTCPVKTSSGHFLHAGAGSGWKEPLRLNYLFPILKTPEKCSPRTQG